MRLLICTQVVDKNDPVLGFFHGWITEFARKCESIEVICLREGTHSLPPNVSVHSLGKEHGRSRLKYLRNFFKYSWSLRDEYDGVFVHMNDEYVVLGGLLWRLLRKKTVLWRNHGQGSLRTRIAGRLAHATCYTSPQAYVARFPNAIQMPIGIDTRLFALGEERKRSSILFLGRLDAIKRPDTFLEAMQSIAATHPHARADLYGDPTPGREEYADALKKKYSSLGNTTFHPAVTNREAAALFQSHQIYVNVSPSGSFDKTIGEAMASGCIVVVANEVMRGIIPDSCLVDESSSESVAQGIRSALEFSPEECSRMAHEQRNYIEKNHALALTVVRVTALFTT